MQKTIPVLSLFLILLISGLCLSQTPPQYQWRIIKTEVNSQLKKITFSDSLHGWAISSKEIVRTTDGGESWHKQSLPFEPKELRRVYFLNNNTGFAIGEGGLILATKDGGNSWIKQNSGDSDHLLRGICFLDDSTGWITGDMDNGKKRGGILLHTTNGGASWDTLSDRSDDTLYFDVKFWDKMNGIIIGSKGWDNYDLMKIYNTSDGGKTLKLINEFGGVQTFELYKAGKDTLWSGGFGFMRSFDHGHSWYVGSKVELPDSSIYLLIFLDFLPLDSKRGYVIISDVRGADNIITRLHYTEDYGNTWKIIPTPEDFQPLSVSMAGKYLFSAGFYGLIITNKPKTSDVDRQESIVRTFELNQNYPNPFNPSTTIRYALLKQSLVEITIYDIMGNKVRSFTINSQQAGYHSILWDGKNMNNEQVSSGTYIYRLRAVSFEDGKAFESSSKMLLVK
ncbi:MAG: YCF48-related protein [Bacteroidota bacterium]|nr:YCF48-related protein [Bacteroidota bacterium]